MAQLTFQIGSHVRRRSDRRSSTGIVIGVPRPHVYLVTFPRGAENIDVECREDELEAA